MLYFLDNQLTLAGEVRAWTDTLRVNSIGLAALRPSLAHFLRILEVLGIRVLDAADVALSFFTELAPFVPSYAAEPSYFKFMAEVSNKLASGSGGHEILLSRFLVMKCPVEERNTP